MTDMQRKAHLRALLKQLRKINGLMQGMFPQQEEAFRFLAMQPHARGAVRTPRRAGKTVLIVRCLQYRALSKAGATCAYITGSKDSARRIVWKTLEEENRKFGFGAKFYRQTLEVHYPNGGVIYLLGIDRDDIVDKIRGVALSFACLDEADFMRNIDLENYIYSALEPTLADHRGGLAMVSTPRPGAGDGFFGRASSGLIDGWKTFRWQMADNPYTADQMKELLDKRLKANPNFLSTSTYRHEFLGEYGNDTENAVFPGMQAFLIPERAIGPKDQVVVGIKPNFYGETAMVAMAWSAVAKKITILESYCVDYRDLEDIVDKCNAFLQIYPPAKHATFFQADFPDRLSMDHLKNRYGLPISSSSRGDLTHWINQFNLDKDSGYVDVVEPRNRSLIHQLDQLSWMNRPGHRSNDRFNKPSSMAYAMMLAFQRCYHYKEVGVSEQINRGTRAYDDAVNRAFIEQLEDQIRRGQVS